MQNRRLQKLIDECPPVRALYPANRHKRRNTTIPDLLTYPLIVEGPDGGGRGRTLGSTWAFGGCRW